MHVLKDEKLGVDREYVAVDRNAEVGEKIYTLVDGYDYYDKGEYGIVHDVDGLGVEARFESNYENRPWYITHVKYHVLEPTDIVHIDGERYRLEDRKAEDGEKVIAKNMDGKWPGLVSEVLDSLKYAVTISGRVINGKKASIIDHGYYYVLTPVQDDAEPKESDIITVLANLGAEVAELKRTVARHQAEINALHEDKVRLGEQLATLAADIGTKTALSGSFIAELLVGLRKAGL
ncbi:hypothetical protein MCZ47_16290 [Bacillus altitudinis]|uniref:hypothetical protein n=1 Tax=Bacillus altitudinis TaxID=293387 RepID=UPI00228138B3|nr:hypothetical protein [Bacillus altitudinis]MCY7451800.1 hypothetical protein [Bacillus altitudinis]